MQHGGDVYTNGILKGKKMMDFSSNINPLGVPESFKKNINEALQNCERYPDIKYRSMIESLKQYNGNIQGEYLVGNGAAELIDLSISCLKSILIVVPSFVEYEISAKKWNAKIEYSYLKNDFVFDYEDILTKLKTVEGMIIGNPNNPNGQIVDKKEFKTILDYAENNNKIIILDEAFVEFTGDNKYCFIEEIKQYKCLFIIRALTKFFALPGIRFGYAVTFNERLAAEIRKKQLPWNVNCFAETAVKYVLQDEKYINDSINWIRKEIIYFTEELNKISFIEKVYTTHSNYVLCRLKNIDCSVLYDLCMKKNFLIRKCDNYKGLDKKYVRFAIKDRNKNLLFIKMLKEIESEI